MSQAEIFLNRAAFILMEQGKLDRAIVVDRCIVEAFPKSGTGYSLLIFFYQQKGYREKMIQTAKAAFEVFPGEAAF